MYQKMWNSAGTQTHTLCLSWWTKVPLKSSALNNNGTCTLQRNLYCDRSEITDCKPAEQPPAETTQSSLPVMRTNISNKKLWNCSCWSEPSPVHSVPLSVTQSSRTPYTQYCCWRPETILVTTQVNPFLPVPAPIWAWSFPVFPFRSLNVPLRYRAGVTFRLRTLFRTENA